MPPTQGNARTARTVKKATPRKGSPSASSDKPSHAPPFDLESDQGKRVRSSDLAGKWHVVYFYPRDNTPGCTREA
jgi:cytochrome oxidase Cu insertion factor (SCO1/SenC/PrrC family)